MEAGIRNDPVDDPRFFLHACGRNHLDALKASFLAAVSKARFVTFWTDAGERVDALVNAFTSLTLAEKGSLVHHPDVSADLDDSDLDLFYDFS